MDGSTKQEEWRNKTLQYVDAVNSFVERGLRQGWDNAGEEPADPNLEHLAKAAVSAIREANVKGQLDSLRELWPPAHAPFLDLLEKNGQDIPVVCLLPDQSILARIGASYESGKTIQIVGDKVLDLDVGFFGRCPNRRFFAISKADGVQVVDGWEGPEVGFFAWPTGLEGVPEDFELEPWETPPTPTRLIPFPDGKRVLLVSTAGIFVLSTSESVRLHPLADEFLEDLERQQAEYPDDDPATELAMEHGAISHDGKLIAVGSQSTSHQLFDDSLELLGKVANRSEYPHYALFSSDDRMLAFNSCHFYNGITIGLPLDRLPSLGTDFLLDEKDKRIRVLEEGSRVYAGACRNNEIIIGNASGYVRAFDTEGKLLWQLFIGSSVGDIDISEDGRMMVVSTYAGFISIIQLDAGQAPHQIGNSQHRETRRWMFWKKEKRPLIW